MKKGQMIQQRSVATNWLERFMLGIRKIIVTKHIVQYWNGLP